MSKNDLNDTIKNFIPKVDFAHKTLEASNNAMQELLKPVDLGDPDNFAPNRTAKSAEQMVEILTEMTKAIENVAQSQVDLSEEISALKDESHASDSKNFRLTYILIGIGLLTLAATVIGIFI